MFGRFKIDFSEIRNQDWISSPQPSTKAGQLYFDILLVDGYAHVMQTIQLTAVVEREGSGYVSLCPELDVASQGDTVEEATANLREAVEAFFECASATEIDDRLHTEVYITRLEVARG